MTRLISQNCEILVFRGFTSMDTILNVLITLFSERMLEILRLIFQTWIP